MIMNSYRDGRPRVGVNRPVASPCDDENGRTWDVMYQGRVLEQGFRTRREARAAAIRWRAELAEGNR